MSTVPGRPPRRRGVLHDPLGRRVQFADVFVAVEPRRSLEAIIDEIRRGRLDLQHVHEVFAAEARHFAPGVRALVRESLRRAYRLLFVEEAAVARSVRELLSKLVGGPLRLHLADAVGEMVGGASQLEVLADAWMWFIYGDEGL